MEDIAVALIRISPKTAQLIRAGVRKGNPTKYLVDRWQKRLKIVNGQPYLLLYPSEAKAALCFILRYGTQNGRQRR